VDLISYLGVLRRRWKILLSVVALTLVVVWVTLPGAGQGGPAAGMYTGKATLLLNPFAETPPNLNTVAVFLTAGEVPEKAAEKAGSAEEPQQLASELLTTVDTEAGSITLAYENPDAEQAAAVPNAFADELLSELKRQQTEQTEQLSQQETQLERRLAELDARLRSSPSDSSAEAARDTARRLYSDVGAQLATLQNSLDAPAALTLLQRAVPLESGDSGGGGPIASTGGRLGVAIGLGLMLGIALALLVERVDSRVRTREQAETAFGLPVLAEIPALPWQHRRSVSVVSAREPGSATAEAYRALRSAVLLLRPHSDRRHAGRGVAHDPAVILVTSARAAEGKTTTVANLAVVMAESGRRVLVLSLDFRNPKVHRYLDVPSGSGLSDLLSTGRAQDLELVVRDTQFPGVRVATSGQETGHPGALLASVGPLIDRARELADIVLIDTAPLLSVSDAVELSPHVDAALVVSRVNRTTSQQAAAAHRLLSRMGVPALGAVLIGTGGTPIAFDAYTVRSPFVEQIAQRFGGQTRRQNDSSRPSGSRPGHRARTRGSDEDE
jgi:capsular exopolysaccharide synthesis family protein